MHAGGLFEGEVSKGGKLIEHEGSEEAFMRGMIDHERR
jgi:hypothetical protein